MSIVTKTGDGGMTGLYCGSRVAKDDIRVELCGSLDEVSSYLGLAKSAVKNGKTKGIAGAIQRDLIVVCSEIATKSGAGKKLKKKIGKNSVSILEKMICGLEKGRCVRTVSFCLPGQNMVSSSLDIARAISRRAERRCVTMIKKNIMKNRDIAVYLNRLSDLLYLLARFNEKKS